MNQALQQALERYYYNDDYGKLPESEGIKEAHRAYYEKLEPLRHREKKLFYELEDLIGTSEVEHERQGFLRGYEYCLTMLGLSNRGGGVR